MLLTNIGGSDIYIYCEGANICYGVYPISTTNRIQFYYNFSLFFILKVKRSNLDRFSLISLVNNEYCNRQRVKNLL